jgi:hypothetical protein
MRFEVRALREKVLDGAGDFASGAMRVWGFREVVLVCEEAYSQPQSTELDLFLAGEEVARSYTKSGGICRQRVLGCCPMPLPSLVEVGLGKLSYIS